MTDDDKPLISSESPSMKRARDEHKNPAPTADPELVAALTRVVELERAFAKVAAAAKRTDVAERRASAADAIAAKVAELGGAPRGASEIDTRDLPVSADEIGYLQSDGEIDDALERCRSEVTAAYQSARAKASGQPELEALLAD